MTPHVSSIISTASSIDFFTKRSKQSPTESNNRPFSSWNEIPHEVRAIIFGTLSDKNRLAMIATSRENSRRITILSNQHISNIASKYYSLQIDQRPSCSILNRAIQDRLYPLNLTLRLEDINNIPTRVIERQNISVKLIIKKYEKDTIESLTVNVWKKIKIIDASESSITSQGLAALLEKCPELEKLNIQGCKNIENLNLDNVASTKIKSINAYYSSITSQGLVALLEKCPELEELHIRRCENIKDLDLSNIAPTKIKSINAYSSSITSQSVAVLLEKCPELEELDIEYCQNIRDLDLSNVASTEIKKIILCYSSITSQGVTALLEKCPELEELSIRYCQNIRDLNLSNVASTKIKKINASYSSITSQGIAALLEKCPEIKNINLELCLNADKLQVSSIFMSNIPNDKRRILEITELLKRAML